MPTYEYRCDACSRTFTVHMSMSEHEKADVTCPACPSCRKEATIPQYSAFFAKTSKKS